MQLFLKALTISYLQRVRYIFIPSNERDYVMMSAAIEGLNVISGHDKGDWWVERVTYVKPTLRRVVHLNSMIQWCVEVLWSRKAQWSCLRLCWWIRVSAVIHFITTIWCCCISMNVVRWALARILCGGRAVGIQFTWWCSSFCKLPCNWFTFWSS